MRKLIIAGAFAAAVFAASCDTLNIGGPLPGWGPQVTIGAGPTAATHNAGQNFTWTANWVGGTAPYSVSWNFGADFNPATAAVASTAGTSDSQTVLMTNNAGATGNVSITVTDAQSLPGTDTAAYAYGVLLNQSPTLTVTAGNGTTSITVQADDPDGDSVTITPTAPAGFTTGAAQTVASGATATFNFSASDIFAGGTGTADFSGDDGNGGTATASATVTSPALVLVADTLYAIPLQSAGGTADVVTIVVATGIPANPFQFNNGTRVTAPTGFTYESNTFNIGLPGGDAGDVDGFWTNMAPGGGFLLAPDNFIAEVDLGGGVTGISFNCTPIGGSDRTTDSGAIFNFGATFAAGTNTLGFAQADGPIKRTYYSDGAATEYFWGDITNNHAGIPNSVDIS